MPSLSICAVQTCWADETLSTGEDSHWGGTTGAKWEVMDKGSEGAGFPQGGVTMGWGKQKQPSPGRGS